MYEVNNIATFYNGDHAVGKVHYPYDTWIDGNHKEGDLIEWTGAIDINKKEIYEGDIVEWTCPDTNEKYYKEKAMFGTIFGVVYWSDESCSFRIEQISKDKYNLDIYNINTVSYNLEFYDYNGAEFGWNELKVVGNIYENKEFYENELKKYNEHSE